MMFEIPNDRLPPGFVETVADPPARPAAAVPAATVVLMRDASGSGGGEGGVEVLLMCRNRKSGFVPGAWVFPGGRVDAADSAPPLYQRIQGLPSDPRPSSSFWTAALRELFEETGVLLARDADGAWARDASSDTATESLRRQLMDDAITLMDVLDQLEATLDAAGMVHIAHWVTPVGGAPPLRHPLLRRGAPDRERDAAPDPREMTDAAWLTPAAALARFEQGQLPMVFPTVRTLGALRHFLSDDIVDTYRDRDIPRILPRLVRTETGVAIVTDDG
jgi:recombination protein RecT